MTHDADVIVVGAGPVGLLLAAELRLAGATPLVLERLAVPSPQHKARSVGPLAAEALVRRGLGERLAAHGGAGAADKARDHGSEKGHFSTIFKIEQALQEEPERQSVFIWQPDLEALLGAYASGLGVEVRREHTVTGLTQDADGVTVTVAAPHGERSLRAAYAVGCDGGRSTVRRLTGFAFPGTAPIMTARRAQAEILKGAEQLPPPGRQPRGILYYGNGMLATFDFFGDTPEERDAPLTAEELQDSVRRITGADIEVAVTGETLRFGDHARQADTYRRGRVLLAGDAAHVHSPMGGQGLNLGLMDAVNLGWKLAAEVRGDAPPGLLDSYTAERHPAGARVLHNTRAQSALLTPGPHTDALRDIFSDLMDLPDVNRHLGRMLSGLDDTYDFPYPSPHPLTGRHCPDLTVRTGTREERLSTYTREGRPVLLAPDLRPAEPWRRRVELVRIESIAHDGLDAVLVRPDGAIAWASGAGAGGGAGNGAGVATGAGSDADGPVDEALETALAAWFSR
ncbi:FAD-dependent monooxygenase [Streptomyces spinosisporus]|uniref:FAD-dependent monooxygenase n=1 Tax=Streptomyces spinosisporus TaxID=2927582 RepID=A0ABS9XCT6_9ACTN|nr:FAD-dependent monooxygenase [Streptomyces spinosisporus]MCI3239895.1 FAD-dependent monooxygenase [Streptomyces spinosisporus]